MDHKFLFICFVVLIDSYTTGPPASVSAVSQNWQCRLKKVHSFCNWIKMSERLDWITVKRSDIEGGGDTQANTGYIATTKGKSHIKGKATLESPALSKGSHCLSFLVKTVSDDSADLNIFKRVDNLLAILYRSRGRWFPDWYPFQLTVHSPQNDKLWIQSNQQTGAQGQIFLDDIKVTQGACKLKPLTDVNVTCDFEDVNRKCGFTELLKWDSCGGASASKSNNETRTCNSWMLSSYGMKLPRPRMAKISDHTLSTSQGHCLISQLFASSTNTTNTAVIGSPLYRGTGTHCISFYYQMFSLDTNPHNAVQGELNLYIIPKPGQDTDESEIKTYWLRDSWHAGNGREWVLAHVQYHTKTDYQVVFESKSTSVHTVYGIDDLTIRSEECPKPSTTTSTTKVTTPTRPPTTTTTSTTSVKPSTTSKPKPPSTKTTTTSAVHSTKTTSSTTTSHTVLANVQNPTPNNTWKIGLGAGGGLVFLLAFLVIFVARRRRSANGPQYKKDKPEETVTYNNVSPNGASRAFNNPIHETAEYAAFTNPYFVHMDKAGEAKA